LLKKAPLLFILIAVLVTAALAVYFYPKLPNRMASHFGFNGQPNGWTSKLEFLGMMLSLQLGLAIFMLALTRIIRKLPISMVNIPHREYWLDENRADETLAWLGENLNWINAATCFFLMAIFYMTLQANLAEKVELSSWECYIALGLYLFVMSIFVAKIILRFRTIPSNQD